MASPRHPETYGTLLVGGQRTHQEAHAAALASDPRSRLIAVADEPDVSQARHKLNQALADDYGIPYIRNLDEALDLPDVNTVSMCADVERRGRVAARCARAGKAIFLDKPLAANLEDASEILAAVEESGVPTQMYSFTGLPWAQAAKRCVESGQIGRLRAVHADVLFAKGRSGTNMDPRIRQEAGLPERYTFVEAKREFFDLGVYAIGLCLWLAGSRAQEVTATTANYFFAEHAGVDVEDFGMAAMTLENGVIATATGGRIGYYSHPKGGPHRIVLVGSEGTETFDAWEPHIEVFNAEPLPILPTPHPDDPMSMWRSTQQESGVPSKKGWLALHDEFNWYPHDVKRFLDCLDAGVRPEISAGEAAQWLEVLMASYRSASVGEPAPVEHV